MMSSYEASTTNISTIQIEHLEEMMSCNHEFRNLVLFESCILWFNRELSLLLNRIDENVFFDYVSKVIMIIIPPKQQH